MLGMYRQFEMCIQRDCGENTMTISEGKDIMMKKFLGDLYDDLMILTHNDKHRVLNVNL